jgi:hypothetical protein
LRLFKKDRPTSWRSRPPWAETLSQIRSVEEHQAYCSDALLTNSVCTDNVAWTIGDRDAQNGTSAWPYFWTCIGLNHMALFRSMTYTTRVLVALAGSARY